MSEKKISKNVLHSFYDLICNLSARKHSGFYFAILYVLVLLSAGLMLHDSGSYFISSEDDFFSSYIPHSELLMNGEFVIDVYRGPFYVIVLSVVNLLIGNYLSSGIIISAVSAGFFLFFVHAAFKRIFSGKAAFIAILFTSINPFFIKYSYGAGTDMFFSALAAASIYFLFRSENYDPLKIILAGFFAALAFLTRYNAIFLFISIPVIIFSTKFISNLLEDRIWSVVFFSGVVISCVAPWGLYTYQEKGEFFYNENYRNVAISLGSQGRIDWDEQWNRKADRFNSFTDIIKEEPVLLFKTAAVNLFYHSYKNIFTLNTLHMGLFSVLGLLFFKRKKATLPQLIYYSISLSFFLLLIPLFYDERFSLFLVPLFSLLAYFGIKAASGYSKLSMGIIFSGLITIGTASSIYYNKYAISGPEEVKLTAAEFADLDNKDIVKKTVASRRPHISYQLNMNWKQIPFGKNLFATIEELRNQNVEYLYFSKIEYNERENLKMLINPDNAPRVLTPVVHLPDLGVVLYKIEAKNKISGSEVSPVRY